MELRGAAASLAAAPHDTPSDTSCAVAAGLSFTTEEAPASTRECSAGVAAVDF